MPAKIDIDIKIEIGIGHSSQVQGCMCFNCSSSCVEYDTPFLVAMYLDEERQRSHPLREERLRTWACGEIVNL